MNLKWKVNNNKCPCKDCFDRKLGCHGYCGRYQEWKKLMDEINEKERQFHKSNDTLSDAKKRQIWKSKRYQNRMFYNKGTSRHD